MTGDCSGCPPLTFGSRCEDCVSNAYRNDDDDCMVYSVLCLAIFWNLPMLANAIMGTSFITMAKVIITLLYFILAM